MKDRLTEEVFRERLSREVIVADGAMGTRLKSHVSPEGETSPDLLTLTRPDVVERVHREYVEAGADMLSTNTYGASRLQLAALGREGEFEALHRAAVNLARQAAESSAREVWVAGSIGPLGSIRYRADVIRLDAIAAEFERQAELLAGEGVDLLLLETMDDFREAVAALRAARKTGLPVIAQLTTTDGETLNGRIDLYSAIRRLEEDGASAVGINCRIGPVMMLRAARGIARYASRPLSVHPNAGTLEVDAYGRMRVIDETDSFAALAREARSLGIGILGGCCHTTPVHIRALRDTIDRMPARDAPEPDSRVSAGKAPVSSSASAPRPSTGARPASAFAERLESGHFVVCVEIDPPTTEEVEADPGILSYKIDGARYLEEEAGIDVVTVADHTMGRPWLDGFPFAEALKPHLKRADILLHYTCRNKAETDITGNFASFKLYGYRNILIITGDRPEVDKSFYAVSSPQLIERVRRDHGDYFHLSCSFDHNRGREREGTTGIDLELKRLSRKIAAGARVALTQPIYEPERVCLLREKTKELPIQVLPGIMPILSPRHARTVNRFPGIHVPEAVIERMEAAGEDREERARIGVEIAAEVARAVRDEGFPGVYLITPLNRFDVIRRVLE